MYQLHNDYISNTIIKIKEMGIKIIKNHDPYFPDNAKKNLIYIFFLFSYNFIVNKHFYPKVYSLNSNYIRYTIIKDKPERNDNKSNINSFLYFINDVGIYISQNFLWWFYNFIENKLFVS